MRCRCSDRANCQGKIDACNRAISRMNVAWTSYNSLTNDARSSELYITACFSTENTKILSTEVSNVVNDLSFAFSDLKGQIESTLNSLVSEMNGIVSEDNAYHEEQARLEEERRIAEEQAAVALAASKTTTKDTMWKPY